MGLVDFDVIVDFRGVVEGGMCDWREAWSAWELSCLRKLRNIFNGFRKFEFEKMEERKGSCTSKLNEE